MALSPLRRRYLSVRGHAASDHVWRLRLSRLWLASMTGMTPSARPARSRGCLPAPHPPDATAPPQLSHLDSAVHRENGARDVAGVVFTQKADHASHFRRCPQPSHRDPGDSLLEHLLRHGGDHLGVDETWSHAVDSDPLSGRFQGQGLGEADESRLGGYVVGLADVAGLPDHRGDVDDAAEPPLQHVVEDRLDHVEGAREIDSEDRGPILDCHLAHGLVHRDAGIVDEKVDPAPIAENFSDHPGTVLWIADVTLVGRDGEAALRGVTPEGLGRLLAAVITGGHVRTTFRQRRRDRRADAARSPGHDGHPSVEFAHASAPSFRTLSRLSRRRRSTPYAFAWSRSRRSMGGSEALFCRTRIAEDHPSRREPGCGPVGREVLE